MSLLVNEMKRKCLLFSHIRAPGVIHYMCPSTNPGDPARRLFRVTPNAEYRPSATNDSIIKE